MGDDPRRGAIVDPGDVQNVLYFLVPMPAEGRGRSRGRGRGRGRKPRRDPIRQWWLPAEALDRLLDLLEASPRAGQPLLDVLRSGHDPSCPDKKNRVWFSADAVLSTKLGPPRDADIDMFRGLSPRWCMEIQYSETRRYTWILYSRLRWADSYRIVQFLHKVIGSGVGICKTRLSFGVFPSELNAYFLPSLRDLVSRPWTRRTVDFTFALTLEAERVIAFNCSPVVELDVFLCQWNNSGQALLEAMRANKCPKRLKLRHYCSVPSNVLGSALQATTAIEELTVDVHSCPSTEAVLSAIGRNRKMRHLVAKQEGDVTASLIKMLWNSVMTSTTIQTVDTSDVSGDAASGTARFTAETRRECAELVERLVRTNPRITHITYHHRAHDAGIMEDRVVPLLQRNRSRPVVQSALALDAPTDVKAVQDRARSPPVGSSLDRNRPEPPPDQLANPAAPPAPAFVLGSAATDGGGLIRRRPHGIGGPGQNSFGAGASAERAEPAQEAERSPPGKVGPVDGTTSVNTRRGRTRLHLGICVGAVGVAIVCVFLRAIWFFPAPANM